MAVSSQNPGRGSCRDAREGAVYLFMQPGMDTTSSVGDIRFMQLTDHNVYRLKREYVAETA